MTVAAVALPRRSNGRAATRATTASLARASGVSPRPMLTHSGHGRHGRVRVPNTPNSDIRQAAPRPRRGPGSGIYTRAVNRPGTKPRSTAMTVQRLAAELVDPTWRDPDRPLVQFVMDWRRYPEQRDTVLATFPPAGTSELVAAKMAAVVHALCDRDEVAVPDWVYRCRAEPEIALFGAYLDTPYGQRIRRRSPRVCASHGVWFSVDLLDA